MHSLHSPIWVSWDNHLTAGVEHSTLIETTNHIRITCWQNQPKLLINLSSCAFTRHITHTHIYIYTHIHTHIYIIIHICYYINIISSVFSILVLSPFRILPVQVTGLQRRRRPHLLEQLHLSIVHKPFPYIFSIGMHYYKELKKWEASRKGELFVIQGLFFLAFRWFLGICVVSYSNSNEKFCR